MTSTSTFSEVNPSESDIAQLPERQPPILANACLQHGVDGENPVTVIVAQRALRQIDDHSHSNLRSELGGALLGHAYQHNGRLYVQVMAALPALSEDRSPIHFKFTADSWANWHSEREANYPTLDIVGWFHTHPDLGVFYSGDDVVVHSAGFTLPWHVGLVVDPVRDEAAFFGWHNGELTAFNSFYELTEEQAESVVGWRAVQTAVYQDRSEPSYTDFRPTDNGEWVAYAPPESDENLKMGLLAAVIGLALGFFLLLGWNVLLQRQTNELETTVLTLADAALAESNAAACPDPNLRLLTPLTGETAVLGEPITFMGTVQHGGTNRFQLQARPAGTEEPFQTIAQRRGDLNLGRIGLWETTESVAGLYDVRLIPVDNGGVRLESASCTIQIELISP